MEDVLKHLLGASHVRVFRHCIRKRHPQWPVLDGTIYEYDQPTTVVHMDTSPEGTRDEIRRQYGKDADELLKKKFQWINFWKPLRGPLNDWPLVLCDPSSLQPTNDYEVSDLLYPNLVTENTLVYFRPGLKWYYLSDHKTNEVIIFKQMDSDPKACPGVPHTSCYNPKSAKDSEPRESIEARAMVFY
ncbi:hypothetical protein F4803DRAFT_572617 [Xylaria telfairii]|nr:hypothetical protein F4803DRAFT_572617 [Xylaria telfairii]